MFPTGAFNQIPMGFQYPGQQQPTPAIYQSQYGGFNPQVAPPRGQSLPASSRQYPLPAGSYAPTTSRRHGQHAPPAPSQHYEHHRHGSKTSKKHHKQRSVSPSGVADQSLYSDKEKNDRSRSQTPVLGSHSKQEETNNNDQEQQSHTVESTSGEVSQGGTTGVEEQQNSDEKEKRQSRSTKKKHHHHHHQHQQAPPLYGELPPHMRVHQQPMYNGYNQAYEESLRRGDVYHKQAKRSTRLPPEVKQQLLPHEDDQQKKYPFSAYPQQQTFPAIHPSFNPYQPYAPQSGFYGPPTPYNVPQPPWSTIGGIHGPAEHEIQRLRSHIHTLEGELHKLQKKLNQATSNHEGTTRTNGRSKHEEVGSPRQTPVIVELNSTTAENHRESSSKKKHRHRNRSSQQGQNLGQQTGETNPDQTASNQQHIDANEHSQPADETEVKPLPKPSREETAAQLAHAAAAHVNARQQVPPPPPVQQQYLYQQGGFPPQPQQIRAPAPRLPVAGNVRYPNDSYQQQQQQQQRNLTNPNYNQSNNNELFDNNEERRHRHSVDKILDAFERFYMNKSTTAPMKVKYIPEDNNSNHHQQRNTNNNNNRDRSTCSSSSSNWSKNGMFI